MKRDLDLPEGWKWLTKEKWNQVVEGAIGKDKDIHTLVASIMFDTPKSEVTKDMRIMGKRVNFFFLMDGEHIEPTEIYGGIRGEISGLCVVASAVKQDGIIWSVPAPGRHHHVLEHMRNCGVELNIGTQILDQGFLLSDGTFATRITAKRIAVIAGQYHPATDHFSFPKLKELYSEDLW